MNKIILMAIAAITAISMWAQSPQGSSSSEVTNDAVTFGFRVGLSINGMGNNIGNNEASEIFGGRPCLLDVHNKMGLNFGVSVEIPLIKSLWLNTGLYYKSTGAKFTFKQDKNKIEDGITLDDHTANLTMHSVRVPVQASYRYNINSNFQLQVNLGPYFAYGFGGKAYIHNDEQKVRIGAIDLTGNPQFNYITPMDDNDGTSMLDPSQAESDEVEILGEANINDNNSNYVKPFDMGIALGAGLTLSKKYFLGVNYDVGLVNVNGRRALAFDHNSIKNRSFSINVGYNF